MRVAVAFSLGFYSVQVLSSSGLGHGGNGQQVLQVALDSGILVNYGLRDEHGFAYEHVSHPLFSEYALRMREPKLCDPSVTQYSGYLDIAGDKHLFFWFFESRSSPKDDPLVLWLNGGPGCSSSTGLLFELGPCNIGENGTSTTRNPHSWNSNANMLFLDQPVNVGHSYSGNRTKHVNSSPAAAIDVYAFLELFMVRFPDYADLPFHIAGESYAGAYIPHIATVIHKKNKDLIFAPSSGLKKINLVSLLLGNALTDPAVQMPAVVDYVCDGPFAVFDPNGRECASMRRSAPICERLTRACYKYDNRATCAPATLYCWDTMFGSLAASKRNLYDVRMKCDPAEDGSLCYKEIQWIDSYMNRPDVKDALGVTSPRSFKACNDPLHLEFQIQGDGMRDSKALLPELVNDGIRLLVYAGNVDMLCNYIGEERWISQLKTKFSDEFTAAPILPWSTESGNLAGIVRSAGGKGATAGNITFVVVYEAGHMAPHDQPENSLDLFTRWINNTPLTK